MSLPQREGWRVYDSFAASRWGRVYHVGLGTWQGEVTARCGGTVRTEDHGSQRSAMVAVELMAKSRGIG